MFSGGETKSLLQHGQSTQYAHACDTLGVSGVISTYDPCMPGPGLGTLPHLISNPPKNMVDIRPITKHKPEIKTNHTT